MELSIGPDEVRLPTPISTSTVAIPHCEKTIRYMFRATCIPAIRNPWRILRYGIPLVVNTILISSCFCMLFYPEYYPTQGEVWTSDLVLITIVYNYMLYLRSNWRETNAFEHQDVDGFKNKTTLVFIGCIKSIGCILPSYNLIHILLQLLKFS